MGRALPMLVCLVLAMHGCTENPQARPSPQHVRRGPASTPAPPPASPPPRSTPPRPALQGHHEPWRRLIDANAESVVHIRTQMHHAAPSGRPGRRTLAAPLCSGGTGVVIRAEGLIVTTGHVVQDAADIKVVFQDGSWAPPTRVVLDRQFDLAVLRIDVPGLDTLTPAPQPVMMGTPVVALGKPSLSLQEGLDSGGLHDYGNLIESTAALEAGFSGGPLLDRRGRLVGLNVAVLESGSVRRGYAIPFNEEVREAVARLCAEAGAP